MIFTNAKKLRGDLILLLTALIWGSSFVAQSVGMDFLGPFTFNGLRTVIGGLFLIPCIFLINRLTKKSEEPELTPEEKAKQKKLLLRGGLCCGLALFVGSNLQQFGMVYTSSGKAGFITALYVILVPVLGLFIKKKVRLNTWVSVLLAAGGLYLLCITENFSITKGDFLILLGSVGFAVHILLIDHFSPKVDGVKMSCIQFLIAGGLSLICSFIFETIDIASVLGALKPLLYSGIMSCGVGYTLQIVGQKDTDPTVASLILSLESVFAVLCGWVILHEQLTTKELLGCVVMFGAIILAQLPARKKNKGLTGK